MRDCATSLQSELADDELSLLLNTLKNLAPKGKVLEIGTAAGGTLWQMFNAVKEVVESPNFVALDPMCYFPNQLSVVKENLIDNGIDAEQVDFRIDFSANAFAGAKRDQEEFELIFVDGNHKCRYVMQDLDWLSLLRVNGFAVFHDYGQAHKGVKKAVDTFLKNNSNYVQRGLVRELLVVEKIAETHKQEVSKLDHAMAVIYTFLFQFERSLKKRFRSA
ncbi:MAG: putative O-methyltransferase YrrM [Chlamydiales bacterium]|jgi:predicted O-methyltransferase YrrM